MLAEDWGELTNSEQIYRLTNIVHAVAAEMEMGYGATDESHVAGAVEWVLNEMDFGITRFYSSRPYLLQEQIKKAIDNLKSYNQLARLDNGELISVKPDSEHIHEFVRDIFSRRANRMKMGIGYAWLYSGSHTENWYAKAGCTFPGPGFDQSRR